jgi:hypothetical protein
MGPRCQNAERDLLVIFGCLGAGNLKMWAMVSPDLVTYFLEEAWIYQDDKYKHSHLNLVGK